MKSRFRNAFLLLLSLLLPVVSPAQTAAEIERATAYLAKTRDAVLASVRGLSAEQLAFKPAPEKWSVAEVLEHIGATEDYLMGWPARSCGRCCCWLRARPRGGRSSSRSVRCGSRCRC